MQVLQNALATHAELSEAVQACINLSADHAPCEAGVHTQLSVRMRQLQGEF